MKSLLELTRREPAFRERRPDPDRMPPRPSPLELAIEHVLDTCVETVARPRVVIAILLAILAATWVATEDSRKPRPTTYVYPRPR